MADKETETELEKFHKNLCNIPNLSDISKKKIINYLNKNEYIDEPKSKKILIFQYANLLKIRNRLAALNGEQELNISILENIKEILNTTQPTNAKFPDELTDFYNNYNSKYFILFIYKTFDIYYLNTSVMKHILIQIKNICFPTKQTDTKFNKLNNILRVLIKYNSLFVKYTKYKEYYFNILMTN